MDFRNSDFGKLRTIEQLHELELDARVSPGCAQVSESEIPKIFAVIIPGIPIISLSVIPMTIRRGSFIFHPSS
jgi:hypothetical protein